jgi:hypothetical protein
MRNKSRVLSRQVSFASSRFSPAHLFARLVNTADGLCKVEEFKRGALLETGVGSG